MRHVKPIFAIAIVACAAMAGSTRISATTAPTADEAIVGAMDAPPVIVVTCFEPTRANIAYLRADCDATAEKYGFEHGVLRPANQNDDEVPANYWESCTDPNKLYVCIAVK